MITTNSQLEIRSISLAAAALATQAGAPQGQIQGWGVQGTPPSKPMALQAQY